MLIAGTRIGPYEITGPLGAGGMGEVYRARDTKLGRDVAVKTLPAAFASDPDRLARLEREARLLATLNHQHIAGIYGLEETGSTRALILEFVPGDTLADIVAGRREVEPRGLPMDDALSIAAQIADALDAAHEKGIIHRDLKPANVKVTPDGIVKVLDFGLAKALERDAGDGDLSQSPTVTVRGTREGMILGTAAYMSPEQARGKPIDKRSDIWSFGCVLYELLTGRRAFQGDTVSDTIAAILSRDPDWSALPVGTPVHVHDVLVRCLAKDRRQRLRDIGDARMQAAGAAAVTVTDTAASDLAPPRPAASGRLRVWAGAAVLAALTGFVIGSTRRSAQQPAAGVSRLSIQAPVSQLGSLAVSRDGRRLVYTSGPGPLYVRALDQFEPQPIRDTEGAFQPFFSPDGDWIGFFVADGPGDDAALPGRLMKVAVSGGPSVPLSDAVLLGGTWGDDSTIVFSRATADGIGLYRILATGGVPEGLTEPQTAKGDFRHGWPDFLPGGRSLLFSISGRTTFGQSRIEALSLETGDSHTVVDQGYHPRLAGGHLAYVLDGSLMVVPFNRTRLHTTGSAIRAVDVIDAMPIQGAAPFDVSAGAMLAYVSREQRPRRVLTWVERDGRGTPLDVPADDYTYPRLSPDGRRLAVGIEREGRDVWLIDLERLTRRPITSDRGNNPPPAITAWSPEGLRLAFNRRIASPETTLEWVNPEQGEQSTLLARQPSLVSGPSWSRDGGVLAFFRFDAATQRDLWVMEGDGPPRAFLATAANERAPRFSADGRWIAYVADPAGRDEVYLRPFRGPGGAVPVSTDGGDEPVWSADGREIFYREGARLMVVSVETRPSLVLSRPRLLFEGAYLRSALSPAYDVSGDGKRFLMISDPPPAAASISVVENWGEELRRLAPTR